jgi:DNA-binding XRE family transcriptional regulator
MVMARQETISGLSISTRLLKQYRLGEITLQRLADIHGVSITTIWRALRRRGICRGSRRGRPSNRAQRALVVTLADQGWCRKQIAEHLGVTPEWVRSILADHGLAVSLQHLQCHQCGRVIAAGHKAHQPLGDGDDWQPLCLACLEHQPDPTLAQRLKTLRLAHNLSLAQLSAQSGLSRAALWNYECGHHQPSQESACKLAQALGISLATLLGQAPN